MQKTARKEAVLDAAARENFQAPCVDENKIIHCGHTKCLSAPRALTIFFRGRTIPGI
ncbi:MAG: hypothetical protein KGI33_10085 [Thaumarchaeota archaeon]|nr:hypothetical protein [Nitrososphaerota archaeon]